MTSYAYWGKTAYLDIQDAKVGHGVLQPLGRAESPVAQHPMEHHLDRQAKDDDEWASDHSQDRIVSGRRQQTHAVNPDHERGRPPVVVVLH